MLGVHNRHLSSELDDDMVPPPMDSEGEEGDEDANSYSRGYDLDDYMHRPTPMTTYSPFGTTNTSPFYSRTKKFLSTKGQTLNKTKRHIVLFYPLSSVNRFLLN